MLRGSSLYRWYLSALIALVAGCLVDSDRPCGDELVELPGLYMGCVCPRGSVFDPESKRCTSCRDHEKVSDNVCVCVSGYMRPRTGAACTPIEDTGVADASDVADASSQAPTGEGESCKTSADCASYDATFCQTVQAPNVCLVQGCATGETRCSPANVCCSFADFPPFAAANGLCIPERNCIGPGKVVKP
jgi:hypothetical protein